MVKMCNMKLVIIGDDSVGKTAVTVRYLTRRFIGEYSNTDLIYKHHTEINDTKVELEIWDTSNKKSTTVPTEQMLSWADAFVIVYNVSSKKTFERAKAIADLIRSGNRSPGMIPVALIGNKTDLEHLREVCTNEGMVLADEKGCQFFEVSAAEEILTISNAFESLMKEVLMYISTQRRRRNSFGTVSKAITSFFGGRRNLNANQLSIKRPKVISYS